MSCQNCGKPATYLIGDERVPLCLDCYERHDAIIQRQLDENARMINFSVNQMESIVGLPPGSLGGRIAIPKRQPVTLNNIRIDRSTVGVINTGQAAQIDAVVTHTQQAGAVELSKALKDFAQAVIDSSERKEG